MHDNSHRNHPNDGVEGDDSNMWELRKENTAPLARGRSMSSLMTSHLTGSTVCERDAELNMRKKKKEQFEKLIAYQDHNHNSNGTEDLLLPWLAYIKWTQDTYSSDTQAAFLLMERCTRHILNHQSNIYQKYRNDTRFLRIAIRYADQTSRPLEMFQYYYEQGIGLQCAVFWVAWAWCAEAREDYTMAEKIFQKALSKTNKYAIKPMEFVTKRYQQFQRRLSRHWRNLEQQEGDVNAEDPKRSALSSSVRGDDIRSGSRTNTRRNTSTVSSTGFTLPSGSRSTSSSLRVKNASTNNNATSSSTVPVPAAAGFTIFSEDAIEEQDIFHSNNNNTLHHRVLESEEQLRKENIMSATTWNHAPLLSNSNPIATTNDTSTAAAIGSNSGSPFEIFVDEEVVEDNETAAIDQQQVEDVARIKSTMTLEQRYSQNLSSHEHANHGGNATIISNNIPMKLKERTIDDVSMAEKLQRDPLRYVKRSQTTSKTIGSAKSKSNTNNATSGSKATISRYGFELSYTNHSNNFEQCRALASYYEIATNTVEFNALHTCNTNADTDDMDMSTSSSGSNSIVGNSSNSNKKDDTMNVNVNISEVSSTLNDSYAKYHNSEEETINQKVARMDISMMFQSETPVKTSSLSSNTKTNSKDIPSFGPVGRVVSRVQEEDVDAVVEEEETATLSVVQHILQSPSTIHPITTNQNPPSSFQIFQDDAYDENDDDNNDTATYSVMHNLLTSTSPTTCTANPIIQFDSDISCIDIHHSMTIMAPSSHNISEVTGLDYNEVLQQQYHTFSHNQHCQNDCNEDKITYQSSNEKLPHSILYGTCITNANSKVCEEYGIKKEAGRGMHGTVYHTTQRTVLKVSTLEHTSALYREYAILCNAHARLKLHEDDTLIPYPVYFRRYVNGGTLELTPAGQCNLLHLIQLYHSNPSLPSNSSAGGGIPELLVMYYGIQMLHTIEMLHTHAKILHGDVKIDNWILCDTVGDEHDKDVPSFSRIVLIDYGRAVDVSTLHKERKDDVTDKSAWFAPSNDAVAEDTALLQILQQYNDNHGTNTQGLLGYNLDAYGVCASLHVLLYGTHLTIQRDSSHPYKWRLTKPLRRYWKKDIWNQVFQSLLLDSPKFETEYYHANEMRRIRKLMESHVEEKKSEVEALLRRQHHLIQS